MNVSEKKQYVVTGIGTGVGKTVVSAILAEALQASYWKPVQAGDLQDSDSIKVRDWSPNCTVLLEKYKLNTPASPHLAASIDGVSIVSSDFELPSVATNLIIEGAGGIMVPLNDEGLLYIDVFQKWNLPVIVISRHYLGSINHTLMTIESLKGRNIPIQGIIFVGNENEATEKIIAQISGVDILIRIPEVTNVDSTFISEQAMRIRNLFQ
jgi:dethiobiotin synthetase